MNRCECLIFDVGGTYMAGSFVEFVNKSYRVLNLNKVFSTQEEIIFDEDYNRGLISYEDCFRKYFGVPISDAQMKELADIWTTTWSPTEEMQELVKKLKRNYSLAILSNSDLLNSDKYTSKGWYSYFDPLILSHELGLIKPEKRIYELALEKIGLPAEKCLFIDDQPKVLIPAQELGMQTLHFKDISKLKADLMESGIIID